MFFDVSLGFKEKVGALLVPRESLPPCRISVKTLASCGGRKGSLIPDHGSQQQLPHSNRNTGCKSIPPEGSAPPDSKTEEGPLPAS